MGLRLRCAPPPTRPRPRSAGEHLRSFHGAFLHTFLFLILPSPQIPGQFEKLVRDPGEPSWGRENRKCWKKVSCQKQGVGRKEWKEKD